MARKLFMAADKELVLRSVMSSLRPTTVPSGSALTGEAAGVALPLTAVSGSAPTPTSGWQAANAVALNASKLDKTSAVPD